MPLNRYDYEQEVAERDRLDEIRDQIAEAHAKGRAHWTEIPRQQPTELERLQREVAHLRACIRDQRATLELIQDIDIKVGNMLMAYPKDSSPRIDAEILRKKITDWRAAERQMEGSDE